MVKLARLPLVVTATGLAGIAATGAALAADMRVKAPVPAVSYGWSGLYIGGNIGLSVARNPTEAPTTDPVFGLVTNEEFHLSPLGMVGGVQAGFNWQVAPNWVWGVEVDFQGSSQKDSRTCVFLCTTTAFAATRVEAFTQRLPWFGTLRGRLGWTDGPVLLYATGGLAYGRVTTDLDFFAAPGPNSAVGRFSEDRWGWTVGVGIEAQLIGNWTGKLEYLYVDLGTVSGSAIGAGPGGFAGRAFAFSSDVRDHIVRLGVNYKLGDPVYVAPAPARGVYKAPAAAVAYAWSGLYIGGNVGLSVARNPSTAPIIDPVGGSLQNSQVYLSPMGVVGGGQIGFNWQAAPNWVWGVEADFQGSGQKDSKTCLGGCEPPAGGGFVEPITQEIPWFGTLRARLGWTNGPVLFYATGGWAYGKVTTDLVLNQPPAPALAGSFSQNKSGWTVGGGIEARLLDNWTGKLEYLYMDLGTGAGTVTSATGLIAGFSGEVHDHIVRVGLNYKLDWAAPVVAKY